MPEQSFDLEIPIVNGQGSESISKATFGTTLNGSITIAHDLQRICPPMPGDPEEKWEVRLYVDDKLIKAAQDIERGQTVTAEGIKTKTFGKSIFRVEVKFSQQWDLIAKINLKISY